MDKPITEITVSSDSRMLSIATVGRLLLAVATLSFGLEHILTGNFPLAFIPSQTVFSGRYVVVLLVGLYLIIAGLGLSWQRTSAIALRGVGSFFLGLALGVQLPALLQQPTNGSIWTVIGELIGLSSGCFYSLSAYANNDTPRSNKLFRLCRISKGFFIVALSIFGGVHFIYASFIATLIPSWISFPIFWAYFIGVAFLASAVSWAINRFRVLSAGLLGLMFLSWVVLVHAPRVVQSPHVEPEWTSMLIALALSGTSWLLAGKVMNSNVAALPLFKY